MEQRHRDVLTNSLPFLVAHTGDRELQNLLVRLVDKKVFSLDMVQQYQGSSPKDLRERVRQMYIDIQSRGPDAFGNLISALTVEGQWEVLGKLSPEDSLFNTKKAESPQAYVSLQRNKPKVEPASSSLHVESHSSKVEEIRNTLSSIKVTPAKSFMESNNPAIGCYSMKSKNRGVCLMINIVDFENNIEQSRAGAEEDEKNLKQLFDQIGFHKFVLHKNLKKKQLEKVLADFTADRMLKHTDCLFVIVASHGYSEKNNNTSVRCHDGLLITTKDIIRYFNSEKCTYLHNVPKVFIFQVCRGDELDCGSITDKENKTIEENLDIRTQVDGRSVNKPIRKYSDILIAYSTVPDFKSHRDIKLGSWYFISMCEVFMEHSHNTHLVDLFRLVDEHLKDICLKRGTLQTSAIETWGFNRQCYLNPGLFPDDKK